MAAITTSTIDYEDQIHYMMSYSGIRSQILNVKSEQIGPAYNHIIRRNNRTKQAKQSVSTLDEFKNDPDVICAIQSDQSLYNTLTSYRKQKIPVIYMYVDKSGFLTIIIKVISYYPVVIIRLPQNDHSIYINPNAIEAYYSFPINHISFKSIGKSSQYQLILHNKDALKLDFNVIGSDNRARKTTINNVNLVPKEIVGTILQTESIRSIGIQKGILDDPIISLNSSIIMMISAVNDIQNVFDFSDNRLRINDEAYITIGYDKHTPNVNRITYSFKNSHINETIPICSETDSILWTFYTQRGTYKKYFIESHDNLFKMNYSKYVYGKHKMYYVITSYSNILLFIRIIWSGDIDADKLQSKHTISFGSLFDKNNQVMDIYMLTEMNDE